MYGFSKLLVSTTAWLPVKLLVDGLQVFVIARTLEKIHTFHSISCTKDHFHKKQPANYEQTV